MAISDGDIQWQSKQFNELSTHELLSALRLRADVFVVEQHCAYADPDALDEHSYHIFGYIGNTLAAYARIVPPTLRFHEPSIGRVLTAPSHRRAGLGKELMHYTIAETQRVYPAQSIRISAQLYLLEFYTVLGFVACSEVYDEDGIPHIEMLLHHTFDTIGR